jgi:hypothetical protein
MIDLTIRPLDNAVTRVSQKTPVGSLLRTAEWERVPLALRERAFFSAGVESARFLTDARQGIQDILSFTREQTPGGPALVDRSSLIAKLREVAQREGIPVDPAKRGGLQDITSRKRLGLIIDTQLAQAREYARWKAEQDPDVLDAFPAQELIRTEDRAVPRKWRERWQAAGGRFFAGRMIARKGDPVWSRISRFQTPWPPFDFQSGMGLRDIDRDEAEALGVIAPDEAVPPAEADFNQQLEASTRGLGPGEISALRAAFGNQVKVTGDRVHWTGQVLPPIVIKPTPPAPAPQTDPTTAPTPEPQSRIVTSTLAEIELQRLRRSLDRAIAQPGTTARTIRRLREQIARAEARQKEEATQP